MAVNLVIWDTAGQEMYNSLVRGYYRVANGVLLVYDVQNADTFLTLSKWLLDLKNVNEKAEVLIAGNKIEDQSKKSVNLSMVKSFAQTEQLEHVAVSAKSGENVEFLFRHLVKKILAARGILSYSKSCLLEKLIKTEAYFSPLTVSSECSNSLEQEDKASVINVSKSTELFVKSITNSVNGVQEHIDVCQKQELVVQEDSSGRSSENSNVSFEELNFQEKDSDTESAECALEFFSTYEGNNSVFSPEQTDIIKLHEETDVIVKNKKSFCVV